MATQYKISRKEYFLDKVLLFEVIAPEIVSASNNGELFCIKGINTPLIEVSSNFTNGTVAFVVSCNDLIYDKINTLGVGDLSPELIRYKDNPEIKRLHSLVRCGSGVKYSPLLKWQSGMSKRIFDVLFSFTFLATLFPLFLIVVAIGNAISSRGPIFFVQKRTGYNGKDFNCYKFRSMVVNEHAGVLQATRNDPRVTRFGSFLRKSSLDELPQFINVFLGDMSVIGPRPHMLKHTEQYSALISKYMTRHFVKPGITGWAQINGHRGETKEVVDMEKRVRCDIWYIEHWSMVLDIKIIFRTIRSLLRRDSNVF